MWTEVTHETKAITDYRYRQVSIDLTAAAIRHTDLACQDMEDFLGGIGRSFKLLEAYDVTDVFAPSSPLVMNLGIFSGTEVMTGLRIFFSAYSPLKTANNGQPLAMWSTASGKFATKLAAAGIDDVVFTGRAAQPAYLLVQKDGDDLSLTLEDATALRGLSTHDKIMALADQYDDAHVAAIGPAGEHWQHNAFAAIACSTVNQLQSRDCKPRFAGRGGMGSMMGSKNLLAIVVQAPDVKTGKVPPGVLAANKEISRGDGSRNYRDARKGNGGGGTWRNVAGLHPVGALPEMNFWPQGSDAPSSLYRQSFEDTYVIKDESCFKCGISCHKNIYDVEMDEGRRKAGKYHAKFDYEPLDLLTINLGIYDQTQSLEIVDLVDQLGFDAISLGATLGYVMDYNRQHPQQPILNGLSFGDFEATCDLIRQTAAGQCPDVGQGVKRLAEALGETAYAMHCKGVELPAYLPETNPGYPFALAGGHMSMRTFLLLVFEGETGMDYWVDAIVNRGIYYTRDDLLGLCKFAGTPDRVISPSFKDLYGVEVTAEDMQHATQRTYLRGLLLERKQGTTLDDYELPARAYERNPNVELPHFITPAFMSELRERVFQAFDEQIGSYGLATSV
jgi:aldehyde:ferredoxin oxidoreductase